MTWLQEVVKESVPLFKIDAPPKGLTTLPWISTDPLWTIREAPFWIVRELEPWKVTTPGEITVNELVSIVVGWANIQVAVHVPCVMNRVPPPPPNTLMLEV